MYYPPCIYDTKNDKNGNAKKQSPCMPFADPPKACDGDETNNVSKDLNLPGKMKKCVRLGLNGLCFDGIRSTLRSMSLYPNLNIVNYANVETSWKVQNDRHLMVLYNKLLLFNAKCHKN